MPFFVFIAGLSLAIAYKGTYVKLLTRVEQLKLLTKAKKTGLLSALEKFGLSLTTIEQPGQLLKAEELEALSAVTNPETPTTLLTPSLSVLILGRAFVFVVPEDHSWKIIWQVLVALFTVVGGSVVAFAASNLVSNHQKN
ncbi:hypothetical protein RND81_04G057800 [Saponaria officinalis]|uniref:Uncharacterized protein n=1 Tax=Saponaria officinalis TaxID=3572 RepID=A0AAW1LI84_SAPOF